MSVVLERAASYKRIPEGASASDKVEDPRALALTMVPLQTAKEPGNFGKLSVR